MGLLVYMTLANLGLAVVFVAVPWLYIGFEAAGAAYLAYLSWQTLKPGGRGLFKPRGLQRDSHGKLLRMGSGHQPAQSEGRHPVPGCIDPRG